MELRCPYCGNKLNEDTHCKSCLKPVDWVYHFGRKSIFYYNQGYGAAYTSNLTLAECYLRKAIKLNKYNIEARNLLGLIYYRTGQIGLGLKEWAISQALKKDDNLATYYLEEIQKDTQLLQQYKEAVGLYNKAIVYAREYNIDMAIIRLKKAMSLNPNFVKAGALLALCYLENKQYHKAQNRIEAILHIDCGQSQALKYYYTLHQDGKKSENTFEIVQQNTEALTPSRHLSSYTVDRSKRFFQNMLYFLLGIFAVVIICTYLIVPSRTGEYKKKISQLTESQVELTGEIQKLTKEYTHQLKTLEDNKTRLEQDIVAYEKQIGMYMQKEKLSNAKTYMDTGTYEAAAEQLYSIVTAQLEENDLETYETLKKKVYPTVLIRFYNEGLREYHNAKYAESISAFEKVLTYEPDEKTARKTLYYLGCVNKAHEDFDEAKRYFNKVISEYSESYEAHQAEKQINEIEASFS